MRLRKIYTLIFLGLFSTQAFSQIPEYCLENDVVHSYLTNVQYDPNDYSYSCIMNYCYEYPWDWECEGKGVRLDFPKPVPIKLAAALDTASTLYVSETEDFSDAQTKTMKIAKEIDSINVYNLIPGRTYNWKLEYPKTDGSIAVAASGQFKTTGTLRMLKIDNVFNVRDMGGWPGLKGYPIKYGKIIRGSRLNVNKSTTKMITASGINELLWAGMRAELDMRDDSNAPMPNGESRHSYLGKDYPIYNVNQGYRSRIATFADAPQSIQGIKQLITWVKQGRPVYMHCSVGADRTGTVAYLVGALCGMSEDALCKDFELTSFSGDKIDNEAVSNAGSDLKRKYERLIRQRDYTGRLDPNDNNESYKFAKMVAKIKSDFPGETLQEKVYYHLKTGVQGTKVSEADLNFLINYLIGPIELKSPASLSLEKGQTSQIEIEIVNHSALNPNLTISYTSSDESIVTVSETGLIKAVGCGSASVTALTNDGFSQTVQVSIAKIESVVPESVKLGDQTFAYKSPTTNKVKDGSFEYGYFSEWMTAKDTAMTSKYFSLTKYSQNADSVYLESKINGDEKSEGSIRMEWTTPKNRAFVFGFRVKNSTNLTTTKNENLKIILTNDDKADDDPAGYTFEYPSYDGNWKEIQYVFETTTRNRLRILFTHLSKDGNNTCFDNFYLVELANVPEGATFVNTVKEEPRKMADNRIYNLAGQEVTNPGPGIYIMNGKKYIVK
ncbi:MAG: tyrosine-protein phosphatase [Bacteroidaceae bacterium]|nr:tyrosine-protein phosphatase [Bacteroidaceae bacterium]